MHKGGGLLELYRDQGYNHAVLLLVIIVIGSKILWKIIFEIRMSIGPKLAS